MSQAMRQALVDHPNARFQRESQRADLLNPALTNSDLIQLLTDVIITKDHPFEFTAVKSDHHDDGPRGHFGGRAADGWFLASRKAGDYLDANDPRFAAALHDAGIDPDIFQLGLAGSADQHANRIAAGATCFEDSGADHIHLGSLKA